MELHPLPVILLLIVIIHCEQTQEKPKPTARVEPQSPVYTGDTVTLTCELQHSPTGWKFLWYKNSQSNHLTGVDENTNTVSITASIRETEKYKCIARREETYTDYSDPVTVTVRERPKAKLKVQPAERVFIRERVTLTCDINGGGVWSYEWLKDNKPLSEAGRRKEYELSNVGQSDGGVYSCKGTQSTQPRYSETSNAVTLTVSETPKPKLISGRKGAALSGNSVVLECRLDVSAGWKFYWSKHRQIPQNEIKTDTQSYTIRSVNVSDEGQYWCRAGRGNPVYYTQYSDALWINITESPKPVVSIKPDEVVFKGEAVTLRCDIQSGGATEWKYSWFKNNQPSSTYTATQEYRISSVKKSDSGKYTCRGERNSDSQSSETSDAVTLTVPGAAQAVLIASLQSWLTEGDSVTLSCEVRHSSTGWTFSWYRDNEEILSDSRRGAGGFYTLSPAALNHSGVYECRAKRGEPAFNTHNSNTQPLWITESPPYHLNPPFVAVIQQQSEAGTSPPVSLIISPSRTQHFSKQTLSLSCEGQSDSTGWRVRRYTVSGKVSDCSSDWRSVTGSTCNISSLSTSHTGVYWCQSESGGRSSPVNITVHNGDVILESPVHPVTDGGPLTLRCLYRSTKPSDLTAHFYRDGSLLGTQTAGQMTISTVSKSAEGLYHCKHAEKGESVKSWISVRFSGPRSSHGTAGLVSGLSLTLLLILVLSLFWCCKKKKGSQSPSAGNQQNTSQSQSLSGPDSSLSASTPLQTDDSAAQPSDVTYAQIITIEKTFRRKDASVEPDNVTYAEIELKAKEKEKRKQKRDHFPRGQTTADADTVYSELK